ncbi:unnamed protein product [Rotaria magnacalcarata]|uniref:EF-hand domain-containing protein n=1 Tax=Rotaria magnacalcarata TaxID=392030 RepID=A0A816PZM4_9BILA|nr:unnamed protein product [Rotaria magnacalcarata]CAF2054447.1 unnamed protein product [Rotaria magnacalcarata]
MGDTDNINEIFQIVDSDGSGYLNKEKLQRICPHLSPSDIDIIFTDLDTDHDNRISLKEFTNGFKELIQPSHSKYAISKTKLTNRDNAIDKEEEEEEENLTTDITPVQINEVFNNLSCQEQIFEFYETLRNGSSESMGQFQSILEVFVGDIMKYRKEIKRLEDSYKREKDMNEKYLRRIEEDQEREMHLLETKIRKEEQQKFESERELIQQRASKKIAELQANLQRLQTIEQCYLDRQSDENSSIVLLRGEISKLTQENQTLNSSLNDSLTTIAILKSDLQSFKTQLNERQSILLQEKQISSSVHREKESLESNVHKLVEVNKKLRDENDSLRAVIESNNNNVASSDIALISKRSMSRSGSILENYWNNHLKAECASSSYMPTTQQQLTLGRFDSFDIDSADEPGIRRNTCSFKSRLDVTHILSPKNSPAISNVFPFDKNTQNNNTMNDSGLSITTVRDATELESDRDVNPNKESLSRHSKQYRSMPTKRNNHDTDSDEKSMDRNNPKRWSQHRSLKRTSTNGQTPTKTLINSSVPFNSRSTRKHGESKVIDVQEDQQILNHPFDRMFKVVFCGDAAVGKSTLIMRLCKGKFVSNINSTLGVDFQNKQLELDSKRIAVQLWDTAGQERFRSVTKSYFRGCDGVILVYDSTYERSFLNVREWIDTITESTPKKVSIMLVANKIDLRDQMRAEGRRVVEYDDGAKLAKEYRALFIETSAKDGINSNEALIELARDMKCNEDIEIHRSPGIDLDKPTKKSTCCGSRS